MFFKKERASDLDEIKDVLTADEVREELKEEIPTKREHGAPLFVKVEKYKDLIATIQELKLFLSGTKQLYTLLGDIESVRAEAFNVFRATMQRLERRIVEMDTDLLRPHGIKVDRGDDAEATHIESSLNDLHKQLMELKKDLQELH